MDGGTRSGWLPLQRLSHRQTQSNRSAVRRQNQERAPSYYRNQRQAGCSQPQPISITCDFSASWQYSLQYLLPSSGGQSHAPCAHLLVCSATRATSIPFSFHGHSIVGGCYEPMLGLIVVKVKKRTSKRPKRFTNQPRSFLRRCAAISKPPTGMRPQADSVSSRSGCSVSIAAAVSASSRVAVA